MSLNSHMKKGLWTLGCWCCGMMLHLPLLSASSWEEIYEDSSEAFWQQDLEDAMLGETSKQAGLASWYGGKFHGRRTANGERFDKSDYTCASRTLPFGTLLEITNPKNGKSVLVRVNDRGPFAKNRVLDVSHAVAKQLGFIKSGVTHVEYRVVSAPPLE